MKRYLPTIIINGEKMEGQQLLDFIYFFYPSNKKRYDKILPLDILE